jgi:hypothetical protein
VKVPCSEFAWADFPRRRLDRRAPERDFDGALQAALQLSGSEAARGPTGLARRAPEPKYVGPIQGSVV